VVGGDADHVQLRYPALAQPDDQRRARLVDALEDAVGGRIGALAEHGLDPAGVEILVELRARGAHHAVRRPGAAEVGLVGEVIAGVNVVVA
jgi:hypothetical protein